NIVCSSTTTAATSIVVDDDDDTGEVFADPCRESDGDACGECVSTFRLFRLAHDWKPVLVPSSEEPVGSLVHICTEADSVVVADRLLSADVVYLQSVCSANDDDEDDDTLCRLVGANCSSPSDK